MRTLIVLVLALCSACPMHARPESGYYTDPAIDELRIEIDDLKHALKASQVELNLLDERIKKQDNLKANISNKEMGSLGALEKKIGQLEKTVEKVATDLRALNTTATQALTKIQSLEQELSTHEKKLDEVAKLKGTLTNISKAIGQKSSTSTPNSSKTYRVKAGDSLEKIARNHGTSAEALRKLNQIANDKIIAGQELRLPDDVQ